jgi:hypothetical protein
MPITRVILVESLFYHTSESADMPINLPINHESLGEQ